jgi:hypothetical protein
MLITMVGGFIAGQYDKERELFKTIDRGCIGQDGWIELDRGDGGTWSFNCNNYNISRTRLAMDALVERIAAAIYAERHIREPDKYHWADWNAFLADETVSERHKVWQDDIRLGVEVMWPIFREVDAK